jgi:hypothetical protein
MTHRESCESQCFLRVCLEGEPLCLSRSTFVVGNKLLFRDYLRTHNMTEEELRPNVAGVNDRKKETTKKQKKEKITG